jgi:outer membrane biogenesis lipoprotein LolB
MAKRAMMPLITAALLLFGCTSAQHQADEAAQKAKVAADQDQADDAECRPYAVPPAGSRAAYDKCRGMLKSSRAE